VRFWPFRSSRRRADAEALLTRVSDASRRPGLFGPGRLPDTLDGRFELMTLHAWLALRRLRQAPAQPQLAQLFTDILFRHLDAGLREAGVGDLSVPKWMHKLAGAFYGRISAYDRALAEGRAELEAALTRNALAGDAAFAPWLAAYLERTAASQAAQPASALFEAWPAE
jgi:cytochrome b pre-mRNA-processing protein 3